MYPIFFTKLSTLGNNYLILNFLEQEKEIPVVDSRLAQIMTNRQSGVFADGIIIITPSVIADLKMSIYNNDGSRAMTCGNGLRMVGKYLKDFEHFRKPSITIETDANIATVTFNKELITVDLGFARMLTNDLEPLLITSSIQACCQEVATSYGSWSVDMISMGNPHYIIHTDEAHPSFYDEMERLSKKYDVNVGMLTIIQKNEFLLTTYERGAGFTGACGTNTAAAVASGVLRGLLSPYETLTAHLPGGTLYLEWSEEDHILATQSAKKVCHGTFFLEEA